MRRQAELFHEPLEVVSPAQDRLEPHVWVRRMIILEEQGKVIRDIPFRKGLNIIWSPDPGADSVDLGESTGSGHGAGKTLFCRLLRYCLGEERFANDSLRHAIGQELPSGLVGAEVMVEGNLWAVIRPLGLTRKHWAIEGVTPEEVLEGDLPQTGIEPLINAISSSLISHNLESALPGTADRKGWLYALGWSSRDQECRFNHLLDWRHADAHTQSPLSGLSKDETFLSARLFLKLISREEMDVRQKRDALPKESSIEQNIDHYIKTIDRVAAELASNLNVGLTVSATDPIGAGILANTANTNLTNIKKESRPQESLDELTPLRKQRDDLIGNLAVLKEQITRLDGRIALQSNNLNNLRGEHKKLDGDALKAEFGDRCPICNVMIDIALAEGCGLSHKLTDVDQIEGDKAGVQEQIEQCNAAAADFEKQKAEKELLLKQIETKLEAVQPQIDAIQKKDQEVRDGYMRRKINADNLVMQASKLNDFLEKKTNLENQRENRTKDSKKYSEQLAKLREQHKTAMTKFNELFGYVSKGFLGGETMARITLTGSGFEAQVQVGGLAMTSLKAVVFDLAALLLTIEGHSHLPAFLLHDSPREADLGLSYYHKLFVFVRKLEAIADEPPFQYIVTTTTEPPKSLINTECHIVTLDGADPSQRLLKRNLLEDS